MGIPSTGAPAVHVLVLVSTTLGFTVLALRQLRKSQ
jgi:hypothetical protein